jgi:serine/threonine-protein kinase
MILSLFALGSPAGATSEQTGRFVFSLSYPAFISAGLSYWVAILFHKLSRETTKARRLGSYQLVEKIGAGGMGEVWKAKHRLLVRPAAIKLIRDDAFSGNQTARLTAIKRFEREAQATAGLRSPHTVELYDFGITGDGTFYYVMELLDGADLRRLVERFGPVSQERAIYLLLQACHSLQDAHLSGIVHRDIKPANIFTCRRGHDYDFVKVLDFGLLAAIERVDDARLQLTAAGTVTGTPAFMAPEIASGNRVTDPRADLYALGCVAYWLLTGQLVFDNSSPMAAAIKHATDPPLPPSTRTELPIHPELERIVLSCLEKDPSKRPASAEVLSRQLAKCRLCVPEWTSELAEAWWRKHLPQVVQTRPESLVTPNTATVTARHA